MTQAQAAEKFGVTRLRVNKSLSEARARGIVRVSINSHLAPCVALEDALCARFNLSTAMVAPVAGENPDLHTIIGAALGQFLTRFLAQPDITLFGMSWGHTLNRATRFMEPLDRPDLEITSVMGGLTKGSDLNSYEITTRLADLCNAQHSYVTAPIYAASPESQVILSAQEEFQGSVAKIRKASGVALAAGDMATSLLMADGLPEDVTAEELIACGAVGDIAGHILNADGAPIDHPINQRVLGIALSDLDHLPNVILAAGGAAKAAIIHALLKRDCVDHLITDEGTARLLLDRAGGV